MNLHKCDLVKHRDILFGSTLTLQVPPRYFCKVVRFIELPEEEGRAKPDQVKKQKVRRHLTVETERDLRIVCQLKGPLYGLSYETSNERLKLRAILGRQVSTFYPKLAKKNDQIDKSSSLEE